VEAGTTQLVLFDEGDVHAELAGTNGGRVATTSAAEYDEVKVEFSHVSAPFERVFAPVRRKNLRYLQ
jgi:hypothetical protein